MSDVSPSGVLTSGPEARSARLILAVDADRPRLTLLTEVLRQEGFDVLTAGSAEEAKQSFDQHLSIDLVIARVVLEFDTGVELAQHVDRSGRSVHTLLVSHFGRDLLNGIPGFSSQVDFLPNPYTREALLSRVRRLLRIRR